MLKICPNIYFAGSGFTGSRFDAVYSGTGRVIWEQGAPSGATSRAVAVPGSNHWVYVLLDLHAARPVCHQVCEDIGALCYLLHAPFLEMFKAMMDGALGNLVLCMI